MSLSSTDILNNEDSLQNKQELQNHGKIQRIIIGVFCGALFSVLLIIAIASIVCRRRQYRSVRRWDPMDLDYGKKLFSSGKEEDDDLEHDFEIDMGDVNLQTRRLLNNN